jgi:hypothetical protein
MNRVCVLALILSASLLSSACYVKQDVRGQWWACEAIQSNQGPAEACYPLPARPF